MEIQYMELSDTDEDLPKEIDDEDGEYPYLTKYLKSVHATEGFGAEFLEDPDDEMMENLTPAVNMDNATLVRLAKYAVEEFNRLKGTELVFNRLVRAVWSVGRSILAYMTLECTDGRFYEAKVDNPSLDEPDILCIFRLAKYYPSGSEGDSSTPSSSKSAGSKNGSSDGSKSDGSRM